MVLGFNDGVANRVPDRSFARRTTPRVISFGTFESTQLMPLGNNSLYEEYSVSFNNRKKADIDDIATFLDSGKGRTNFSFTIPDTSSGGTEKVIKVVCEEYTMSYLVDNYYSLEARLRRVYEP